MRTIGFVSLFLAATLLLAVAPGALAGDREQEQLEMRIEVLLTEARALKAEGRHDAADVLLKRVHELKTKLEGREAEPMSMEHAEKVLHGLEMGMESLKALGRHEELRAVARVADELRAHMKRAHAEKRAGGDREREAVRRWIELWQEAAKAYREIERPDLVGHVERILHAHEIALSGRRDDEARAIMKNVPGREDQAELLAHAAHLFAEWGHETRAARLNEASQEVLGRKKDAAQPKAGRVEVAREHLESLQRQMKEIREMVVRLREQIEAMQRAR